MPMLFSTGAQTRRRIIGAAAAAAAGRGAAWAAPAPVVLGQVQLSFYAVAGGVIQEVLERLGHTVEVREGSHETIFPMLGSGAVDLMAAAWLPQGHASYWKRFGADAVEVAPLYDGARFFLGAPSYVPVGAVSQIADLARPDVAARMSRTVQSIGAGATITTVAASAMKAYGLDALGYEVRPGTAAQWMAAWREAQESRAWIVFPSWAPQFLNRDGAVRPLGDPQGVLGGTNRAVLVAPRARLAALAPRTQAVLSRVRLGLDAVTRMDWMVNVDGLSPRQAARTWMNHNRAQVVSWFAP